MTQYLISFDDGAMTFPEHELPDVADEAHAVAREVRDTDVWVCSAGLKDHEQPSTLVTDGTETEGLDLENRQNLWGFTVVDVPSRQEALQRAAKVAGACRCSQEVGEILADPAA